MRRYKFILLMLVASLAWGCQRDDLESYESDSDISYSNVEVLEDGRLKVTTSLERLGMTSIETRASSAEDNIYNGWCLVFGATDSRSTNYDSEGYGDQSPLIQKVPITANANGTFFMTFDEFDDKAFMRIVVNLTDRENETLENDVVSWQDLAADNEALEGTATPDYSDVVKYRDNGSNFATFAQFRHQSVGLDGIYNITYNTKANLEYIEGGVTDYSGAVVFYTINYETDGSTNIGTNYLTGYNESYNDNAPYPSTQLNTTTGFPMASYGFVLDNLSETTLENAFGTKIDMIRVCSKVVVDVSETYVSGSGFDMQEVYLIDAPQEARIRSTVLSSITYDSDGNATEVDSFSLPVDLGGTIDYEAMPVTSGATVSDPIYFYPNSGGDYQYSTTVNNEVNPQYIIIKGQAAGYDTPGYYKVALKAQYPLVNGADPDKMDDTSQWSALTYDILRNTFFTVKITDIDKPGYKTFDDAADPNSPANNISYSITIEVDNNYYEMLVSNGTYYVELHASRIYYKGWENSIDGEVEYKVTPNEGCYTPAMYVRGDYGVTVDYCTVNEVQIDSEEITDLGDGLNYVYIDAANEVQSVVVHYTAYGSGRIRIRIGDMLKFIPVRVDGTMVSSEGETLVMTGEESTSFAYDNIASLDDGLADYYRIKDIYTSSGDVNETDLTGFSTRSVAASIYNVDGTAYLYFTQASPDDPDMQNAANTINLGTSSSSTTYGTDMSTLASDVLKILEDGYTTVYFEGYYLNDLITDTGHASTTDGTSSVGFNTSIFMLIDEGATSTYSLDFSAVTAATNSTTSYWPFRDLQADIFNDLIYLKSLTLPSTVYDISVNSFYGCSSLESVTIGSATNPTTGRSSTGYVFEGIDAYSFAGMRNGCVVTLYTTGEISGAENDNLGALGLYYVSSAVVTQVGITGGVYEYVFNITSDAGEVLTNDEITYINTTN